MEDIILYPTVVHICILSVFLLGMLVAGLLLLKGRLSWQIWVMAGAFGIALAAISFAIRSTQSTGDGYWTFRGWPHWFHAVWRSFATGEASGGWRVGTSGIYIVVDVLFWMLICLFPMAYIEVRKQGKLTGRLLKRFFYVCLAFILVLTVSLGLIYRRVQSWGEQQIVDQVDGPYQVAIVFGAGLWNNETPSDVLRDRVTTAVQLYREGMVSKLLMSGDNRFVEYNEPEAMRKLAIELGMPDEDIVLDYAGRRTYDTCYRASQIFGLDEAVLVTNRFHLPRALYTCKRLGVEGVGVASDLRPYTNEDYWRMREIPASIVAWLQTNITKPEPILGQPEPIE